MKFVLFSIVLLFFGIVFGGQLPNNIKVSGSLPYIGQAAYQSDGYETFVPLNTKGITVSIEFK